MAQFLRPDGNITQTGVTGGFAEIDETSASDSDFAYGADGGGNVLEVSLSDVSTPGAGTTTVRYRHGLIDGGVLASSGSNGNPLTIEVYEGATQRASTTATMGTSWTTATWTPDLSAITDWTDVRLRFSDTSHGGSPGSRRAMGISWAEIEVPDASVTTTITVTAGTMDYVEQAVVVNDVENVAVTAGTMDYAGQTITIPQGVTVSVTAATMDYAEQAIVVNDITSVATLAGTLSYSGQSIVVNEITNVSALAGTISYSGQAITVNDKTNVNVLAGAMNYVGQAIGLDTIIRVIAATMRYAGQSFAQIGDAIPKIMRTIAIRIGIGI